MLAVLKVLKVIVNDENEQKEGERFQFPWYGGGGGARDRLF